jgi:hypothetical protein
MRNLLPTRMRIMPFERPERLISRSGSHDLRSEFDLLLNGCGGGNGKEFSSLFDEWGRGEMGVDAVAEFWV